MLGIVAAKDGLTYNDLMRLSYIRHAQHIPRECDVFYETIGLTDMGIQESLEIRNKLRSTDEFTKIKTFPHLRALGTLAVVTSGDCSLRSIDDIVNDQRLAYDNSLDYIDPGEGEFGQLLIAAYLKNRNFSFIVNTSDSFFSQNNPISSFTYMSSNIANDIIRLSEPENSKEDILLCAREFVLPVVRAKLIRNTLGDTGMKDYVDWYTAEQEATDQARLAVTTIETIGSTTIRFVDEFDDSLHSLDEFREIRDEINAINPST